MLMVGFQVHLKRGSFFHFKSMKRRIFISRGCAGNTESSIMGKSIVWNISEWPTMPKLHNNKKLKFLIFLFQFSISIWNLSEWPSMPKLHDNQFRHIWNKLKQHSPDNMEKFENKLVHVVSRSFASFTFLWLFCKLNWTLWVNRTLRLWCQNLLEKLECFERKNTVKLYWLQTGYIEMDLRAESQHFPEKKVWTWTWSEWGREGEILYSMHLQHGTPTSNLDFSARFDLGTNQTSSISSNLRTFSWIFTKYRMQFW